MKKLVALALVAAMFMCPLMSAARALEPVRNRAAIGENDGPEGRRGRSNHRRGRGHRRGGSSGAGLAGAIIGGLIVGGIIAGAAQSQKAGTPALYCDQYGNCRYQ